MQEEPRAELTTFSCRESVVYMIPPASTVGHRAELWNVDNPLQVNARPVELMWHLAKEGSLHPLGLDTNIDRSQKKLVAFNRM